MLHVLDDVIAALKNGESVVLCGIVRSVGSAPRTSGARMLIRNDGTQVGTVGGGAAEGACLDKAKELFENESTFAELHFDLTSTTAADEGMVCGGAVSVLLVKVGPETLELYQQLYDDLQNDLQPLLITRLPAKGVSAGIQTLCSARASEIDPTFREELVRKTRRVPFLIIHDDQEYFVEPLTREGTLYLVGAGHVAFATSKLAAIVGFNIVVMDDRADFANPERYPDAKEVIVLDDFSDCISNLKNDDYVVIVTRGHMHDRDVLAQALKTKAKYIGMIGSIKKQKAVYDSLRVEGLTDSDFARVYNPIGLSIGADTPEEIGLSIVAQMVQIRAGVE